MSTRVVTAKIPAELAERVDAYARSADRTSEWVVEQALESYVRDDERLRLSLEAIKDAEQHGVVSQEDVLAWASSLSSDTPLPAPTPRKR